MVETTLRRTSFCATRLSFCHRFRPLDQIRLDDRRLADEDVNVSTCLEMAERAIQQADDLANHRPSSRGVLPVGRAAPAVVVDPGILDRCASLVNGLPHWRARVRADDRRPSDERWL